MKIRAFIVAALICTFVAVSLTGCNPHSNRMYALDQFRKAGASSYVVNKMDCIGNRESRWQATAVGGPNGNGTYDLGIFQINSIHQTQFRQVTGQNYWTGAKTLRYNVQYAVWLWRKAGLSPWRGGGC